MTTLGMKDYDLAFHWRDNRCGYHMEDFSMGYYVHPDPKVCTCQAPANWFFPYDIRYVRVCRQRGQVDILAPEVYTSLLDR